jgi:hypothetical protein
MSEGELDEQDVEWEDTTTRTQGTAWHQRAGATKGSRGDVRRGRHVPGQSWGWALSTGKGSSKASTRVGGGSTEGCSAGDQHDSAAGRDLMEKHELEKWRNGWERRA